MSKAGKSYLKSAYKDEVHEPFNGREKLSDEEKQIWDDTMKVIRNDTKGFLEASLLTAVQDKKFREALMAKNREVVIKTVAARLAPCEFLTKLPLELLQTLIAIPADEFQHLSMAVDSLQQSAMEMTPGTLKEIVDMSIVMHVLEEHPDDDSVFEKKSEGIMIPYLGPDADAAW